MRNEERQGPRFKAYARLAGLVDHWRACDWHEFYRPMGADDFEYNRRTLAATVDGE